MNRGTYSGSNSGPHMAFEPQGGHVVPAQPLLPVPDYARVVAVTLGSGTIRRLPAWGAYSEAVVLIFRAVINLINSAYLVLPNGQDIVTAVDDMALAVPIGDGRWSLKYGFQADNAPWVAYTPIIEPDTGAFGAGSSASGRYKIVGRIVTVSINVNIPLNGTGGGFFVSASLPIPTSLLGQYLGGMRTSPDMRGLCCKTAAGNILEIYLDGIYPGEANAVFQIQGSYEIQ